MTVRTRSSGFSSIITTPGVSSARRNLHTQVIDLIYEVNGDPFQSCDSPRTNLLTVGMRQRHTGLTRNRDADKGLRPDLGPTGTPVLTPTVLLRQRGVPIPHAYTPTRLLTQMYHTSATPTTRSLPKRELSVGKVIRIDGPRAPINSCLASRGSGMTATTRGLGTYRLSQNAS